MLRGKQAGLDSGNDSIVSVNELRRAVISFLALPGPHRQHHRQGELASYGVPQGVPADRAYGVPQGVPADRAGPLGQWGHRSTGDRPLQGAHYTIDFAHEEGAVTSGPEPAYLHETTDGHAGNAGTSWVSEAQGAQGPRQALGVADLMSPGSSSPPLFLNRLSGAMRQIYKQDPQHSAPDTGRQNKNNGNRYHVYSNLPT